MESVSVTDMRTFLECRRKFFYIKILGFQNHTSWDATVGLMMHDFIQHRHTGTKFELLPHQYTLDQLKRIQKLMDQYIAEDESNPVRISNDNITGEVKVENSQFGIKIKGRLDAISFDENGVITLMETKTASKPWDLWRIRLNFQTKLYSFMINQEYPNNGMKRLFNIFNTTKGTLQREVLLVDKDKELAEASVEIDRQIKDILRAEKNGMSEFYRHESYQCALCPFASICEANMTLEEIKLSPYWDMLRKEER